MRQERSANGIAQHYNPVSQALRGEGGLESVYFIYLILFIKTACSPLAEAENDFIFPGT
jgi:hypothetical protein